jgi:hypothetical protein
MRSLKCIFHIKDCRCLLLNKRKTSERKDGAIVIVDEEESNKSKEKTPLVDEGIKDELKEETHVVQDIEQGDEDVEEEDNLK